MVCGSLARDVHLRLSPPTAFAIHHFHIQMAPIVYRFLFFFFLFFSAKWPLLNLSCISVGSNFIIHLVVQLPLFIEEEVEIQRREISWSKLPSSVVSQLKEEHFYLLDLCLVGASFSSPEPDHFGGNLWPSI